MTIFLTIVGVLVYLFIGSIVLTIAHVIFEVELDPSAFGPLVCWPIMAIILLGFFFATVLPSWLAEKIKKL